MSAPIEVPHGTLEVSWKCERNGPYRVRERKGKSRRFRRETLAVKMSKMVSVATVVL